MTATDSYLIFLKHCFRQLVHILENTGCSFVSYQHKNTMLSKSSLFLSNPLHSARSNRENILYATERNKQQYYNIPFTMFALLCSPVLCYSSSVYILPFSCALLGSMCNRRFSSSVLFLTQPALKNKLRLYYSTRQLPGKRKDIVPNQSEHSFSDNLASFSTDGPVCEWDQKSMR